MKLIKSLSREYDFINAEIEEKIDDKNKIDIILKLKKVKNFM